MSKLFTAIAAVLALSAGLVGAAPPEGKGPPDGGEDTAAQNLSVPTIMVGGSAGNLTCGSAVNLPSALVPPSGDPLTGYELPGYFYVQKVHTWQAQCFADSTATVYGAWGDNLAGDAKLKAGKPIRVELVLWNQTYYEGLDDPTSLQGYNVVKLEPSKLDRLSKYGHLAGGDVGGFYDIPTEFVQVGVGNGWLVHDAGITFGVQNLDTDEWVVPEGTSPTAEINATGRVVYGYQLIVDETGTYRITFRSSPTVKFKAVDAGGVIDDDPENENGYEAAWIDINVAIGGGGGGKKGRPER